LQNTQEKIFKNIFTGHLWYANSFNVCLKKKERNEEKSWIISRARVPTWEISSLRLTNWTWLRFQVLTNRYSNKVPRGWVARCGDEFFIHPCRMLIKTRCVACTPSRRRKDNSLKIKITLERKKEKEGERTARARYISTRVVYSLQWLRCTSH